MATFHIFLLIIALVAFGGATFDVKFYRLNLMGLGLCCWLLAELVVGR